MICISLFTMAVWIISRQWTHSWIYWIMMLCIVECGPVENYDLNFMNCKSLLTNKTLNLDCDVGKHFNTSLSRETEDFIDNGTSVSLAIKCTEDAEPLTMIWPAFLKGVRHLRVTGCVINLKYPIQNPDSIMLTEYYENVSFQSKLSNMLNVLNSTTVVTCELNIHLKKFEIIDSTYIFILDSTYSADLDEKYEKRILEREKCIYRNLERYNLRNYRYNIPDILHMELHYIFNYGYFPQLNTIHLRNLSLVEIPYSLYGVDWWVQIPKLSYLDLQENNMEAIPFSKDNLKQKLRVDLRRNKIRKIPKSTISLLENRDFLEIDISENPYDCSCTDEFLGLLPFSKSRILENVTCFTPSSLESRKIKSLTIDTVCIEEESTKYVNINIAIIIPCLVTVIIFCSAFNIFRMRRRIITLCSKGSIKLHPSIEEAFKPYRGIGAFSNLRNLVKDDASAPLLKDFDAFISYCHTDEKWVLDILCKRLEEHHSSLKLCLHHKHFMPGTCISDNIIQSIERSKYTLLVLSQSFLKSEWCILEFKTAFLQTLRERAPHLVIVLLEQIPEKELDFDMKYFLKTHTYLQCNEQLFWDKLFKVLTI